MRSLPFSTSSESTGLAARSCSHDVRDVVPDGVGEPVAGLVRRLIHRGTERRHQIRQLARERAAFERRGDGAAVRVPHDDDQRHVQVLGRVFEAGGLGIAGDVAGHADVEDVPEALVEDDLGRHAGVGTRQDRAMRVLARGQRTLTGRRLMRVLVLLRDVMSIARLELGEHGVGGRQGPPARPTGRRPRQPPRSR